MLYLLFSYLCALYSSFFLSLKKKKTQKNNIKSRNDGRLFLITLFFFEKLKSWSTIKEKDEEDKLLI